VKQGEAALCRRSKMNSVVLHTKKRNDGDGLEVKRHR